MIQERTKHPSILIVDDETKNIQLLGNLLSEESYEVEIAMNGEEALDWLQEHTFDLILLDIMMPGIDGYEVCRKIKSNPDTKNIPIIFLTAKTETDDIIQAFEIGAVDYVLKPFKTLELLSRIHTHLTIGKQRKELEELNANKDKFFSIISHDLRSPFSALFSMIALFNENLMNDPEDLKEMMRELKKSGDRVYKLLNNLLEWARLQKHSINIETKTFDLSLSLKNVAELFKNAAREKNILIELNILNDPCEFFGDENMMATVFRNLVNNAIKFTRSEGKVTISCCINSENLIEVKVSDTGIGIRKEEMIKLFRIDQQLKYKGTAGEVGTGLGLIICKEFINMHNGNIMVDSEFGKGTTFIIHLKKNFSQVA